MAEEFNLYQDIAGRTGGSIYIGCVGPVRTGKSTFSKNFMAVSYTHLDVYKRQRTVVLVSHRLSTMRIADTVYSVENGRLS